jgi:hypothetical protein
MSSEMWLCVFDVSKYCSDVTITGHGSLFGLP